MMVWGDSNVVVDDDDDDVIAADADHDYSHYGFLMAYAWQGRSASTRPEAEVQSSCGEWSSEKASKWKA